jgi:hypothetical protein
MTSPTECAAPARPLPHEREHVEGSAEILQDIERHLQALRGMAAHITRPTLRRLMGIEISLTEADLRRFLIVRTDPCVLAGAERARADVRDYVARRQYTEGLGYAKSALARVVQDLGGAPMPPLFLPS